MSFLFCSHSPWNPFHFDFCGFDKLFQCFSPSLKEEDEKHFYFLSLPFIDTSHKSDQNQWNIGDNYPHLLSALSRNSHVYRMILHRIEVPKPQQRIRCNLFKIFSLSNVFAWTRSLGARRATNDVLIRMYFSYLMSQLSNWFICVTFFHFIESHSTSSDESKICCDF